MKMKQPFLRRIPCVRRLLDRIGNWLWNDNT